MKKATKIGITFVVLSVLVIGIGIIFATIVHKHNIMEENKKTIKDTFNNFSLKLLTNYTLRDETTNKLANIKQETYKDEHEEYAELLTKYNNNMNELKTDVATFEDKCTYEYDSPEIGIYCKNYQVLYEVAVNIYVNNLTNYNNVITTYNQTAEEDYELFTLVYQEQLDYNNNGIFENK